MYLCYFGIYITLDWIGFVLLNLHVSFLDIVNRFYILGEIMSYAYLTAPYFTPLDKVLHGYKTWDKVLHVVYVLFVLYAQNTLTGIYRRLSWNMVSNTFYSAPTSEFYTVAVF